MPTQLDTIVVTPDAETPDWLALPDKSPIKPVVQPPDWLALPPNRGQVQSAVSTAAKTVEPDKFAKALDLSRRTDIPAEVVERNLDDVARERAAQDSAFAMSGTGTERWYMSNPDNMKVASDSGPALVSVENAINSFRAFSANVIDFGGSVLRGAGATNDVAARALARPVYAGMEAVGLGEVAKAMKEGLPWWLDPGQVLARPGQQIEKASDIVNINPEDANFITDVAGGLGNVSAQITAAILTGGATSFTGLFFQGVDQASKSVDKAGKTGTPGGDTAALAGGAIAGVTEKYGLDLLLKHIPATVRSRIGRVLAGASTEAVQEIAENVLNNLTALALYNPEANIFGEDDLHDGAVGGAVGAIVSAIVPGKRAINARKKMDDVKKELDKSPLTQRDPEKAVEHASEMLKDAGVEVYVDANALFELSKASTAEEVRDYFDRLGVGDQLEGAMERGGSIRLSEDAFVREILLSDQYEQIADHVRFGATEMTAAEAKEIGDEVKVSRDTNSGDKALADAGFTDAEIKAMSPEDKAALTAKNQDEEILTLAEDQMGLQALYKTAKEAGMTDEQYSSYLTAIDEAKDASRVRIAEAKLKQQQREASEDYKRELETKRAEIEESVNQRQVYQAIDGIQNERLDREALVEILPFGEDDLARLPKQEQKGAARNIFTGKGEGGINPEIYAHQHGYEDAATMLREMAAAPSKQEVVDAELKLAMRESYEDLNIRTNALRSAIQALHNDKHAEVLATELHQLQGAKKAKRLSPKLFKAAAKERMASMRLGDVTPAAFFSEMARKGKAAGKAIRKGLRSEAVTAKFQQLLNFQMAREAYDIKGSIERDRKFLEKLLRPRKVHRNIDADYLDKARELLANYSLTPKATNAQRLKLVKEAQARAEQTGEPVKLPPRLERDDTKINYQDLTVREWEELVDNVRFLVGQGRRAKQYAKGLKLMEFEDAKRDLIAATDELPDLGRMERQRTQQNPGWGDRARSTLASLHATVKKVEFMLRQLDGGKTAGVWNRTVYEPMAEAQSAELDLFRRVLEPIMRDLDKLPKAARKRMKAKVFIPGLNRTMSGADIMMMALNAGNESNYRKMLEGSAKDNGSQPWTEEGVREALDRLGPEEAAWVQKVWDAFEKMRPAVERVYRDENGISPDRIVGRSVSIAGQSLRGGYFPMMYDPARAPTKNRQTILEMMEDPLIRGAVFSGMTKGRIESYSAPVLLDISALGHAIRQSVHFITHYEAVKNVRQILEDKELAAVVRNKIGPENHAEMKNWLEAIATNNADRSQAKGVRAVVETFRQNLTVAALGFSYTTGIAQVFGAATTVAEIGPKWTAVGYDEYLANPRQVTKWAKELSNELKDRIANVDRDMSDKLNSLSGKTGLWVQQQRISLMAIGGIQLYTVDIPSWVGAFNKAIAENKTEDEAVDYADSVLRTSQASGHVKDLSALQREKGLMRWATMFSTYTMVLYNLQAEAIGNIAQRKDVTKSIVRLMWLTAIPAVLDSFMRGQGPGDDEDYAAWAALRTLRYSMSSIPVVGQGIASLMDGFPSTLSSIESLGPKWVAFLKTLPKILKEDEELTAKDVRKLIEAPGRTFGLGGTAQIVRTLNAIGEEDDELYRLLVGPKPKN